MSDPKTEARVTARSNRRADSLGLIVVIADDAGVRESLLFLLGPSFEVRAVASGEAALSVMREELVDVILLDLPSPTGVETLANLRQVDEQVEVVITGHGSYQSEATVLRLRTFDYISKPFDSSRVLSVVRRAAERCRLQREREQSDRFQAAIIGMLDVVDSLAAVAEPDDSLVVRLDYMRLLVQSLRDSGHAKLANVTASLQHEIDDLEWLVPSSASNRDLGRLRMLLGSLPVESAERPPAEPRFAEAQIVPGMASWPRLSRQSEGVLAALGVLAIVASVGVGYRLSKSISHPSSTNLARLSAGVDPTGETPLNVAVAGDACTELSPLLAVAAPHRFRLSGARSNHVTPLPRAEIMQASLRSAEPSAEAGEPPSGLIPLIGRWLLG